MPTANDPLMAMFAAMSHALGPSGWWPADSPLEVVIGAVLTQNTSWRNVEKALATLKAAHGISGPALLALPEADLAAAIQPAGYFRVKAKRLRNVLLWLQDRCNFNLPALARRPLHELRPDLLAVNGVGPETSDAILCYALHKPTFVVDAYTSRILERHGRIPPRMPYESLRAYCMDRLPKDVKIYNEMHALLVRVGHAFCRPKAPCCGACPLEPFL